MCFRIAVRALEAWLMADRERFATFLGVARAQLPSDPETVDHPKQLVVDLARQSSKRAIREGVVPRAGSGRTVGPLYVSEMIGFIRDRWRPAVAASIAGSLERSLSRLTTLNAQF
jgi:hypothetical protein